MINLIKAGVVVLWCLAGVAQAAVEGDLLTVESCIGAEVMYLGEVAVELPTTAPCSVYLIPIGLYKGPVWWRIGNTDRVTIPFFLPGYYIECPAPTGQCATMDLNGPAKAKLKLLEAAIANSRAVRPLSLNMTMPSDGRIIGHYGDVIRGREQSIRLIGINLAPRTDSLVLAPADGIVIALATVDDTGIMALDHGSGVVSTLVGLDHNPQVAVGATLLKHYPIGHTQKDYLHWSVSVRGVNINPQKLLK